MQPRRPGGLEVRGPKNGGDLAVAAVDAGTYSTSRAADEALAETCLGTRVNRSTSTTEALVIRRSGQLSQCFSCIAGIDGRPSL